MAQYLCGHTELIHSLFHQQLSCPSHACCLLEVTPQSYQHASMQVQSEVLARHHLCVKEVPYSIIKQQKLSHKVCTTKEPINQSKASVVRILATIDGQWIVIWSYYSSQELLQTCQSSCLCVNKLPLIACLLTKKELVDISLRVRRQFNHCSHQLLATAELNPKRWLRCGPYVGRSVRRQTFAQQTDERILNSMTFQLSTTQFNGPFRNAIDALTKVIARNNVTTDGSVTTHVLAYLAHTRFLGLFRQVSGKENIRHAMYFVIYYQIQSIVTDILTRIESLNGVYKKQEKKKVSR